MAALGPKLLADVRDAADRFIYSGNNQGVIASCIGKADEKKRSAEARQDDEGMQFWEEASKGLLEGREALKLIANPRTDLNTLPFKAFNLASQVGSHLAKLKDNTSVALIKTFDGPKPSTKPNLPDTLETIKVQLAKDALRPALQKFWSDHRAKFAADFDPRSDFMRALRWRLPKESFDKVFVRIKNDFITPFEHLKSGISSNAIFTSQASGVVPVFAASPLLYDIEHYVKDIKSVMPGFPENTVSDYSKIKEEFTNTIVPLTDQLAACRAYAGKEYGVAF